MKYEEIREWLDKLISLEEEKKRLKYLNNQISTCTLNGKYILFYSGIEIVARIMGLELHEEERTGNYEKFLWFDYGGYTFEQLNKEN